MKELKMYGGQSIGDAYRLMKDYSRRTGEVCFVNFNDQILYSYDSWNAIYMKVTHRNRRAFEKMMRDSKRKTKKSLRRYLASLPKWRRELKSKARGVIDDKYLDKWDECVNIRTKDLYRGFELKCVLELIQELNRDIPKNERFENCKAIMFCQDHTGGSAYMTLSCLRAFHDLGEEAALYLR